MGRPVAVREPSNALRRKFLFDCQEQRFTALRAFRRSIADDLVIDNVKSEDGLFADIVRLAVEEYGVTQAEIAERTLVSAAAVGRWAKQINLPQAMSRGPIVREIVAILDDFIDSELQRGRKSGSGKLVLPSGRVRH